MLRDCQRIPVSSYKIIRIQMDFVKVHTQELYHLILALQKEAGGVTNIVSIFGRLRSEWNAVAEGQLHKDIKAALAKLPNPRSTTVASTLYACCKALKHNPRYMYCLFPSNSYFWVVHSSES